MDYKVCRNKKSLKGKVHYTKTKPYVFNPAYRKNDKIIDINKLSLYNSYMINNVLQRKYIRKYKNLLKMVYLYFNDPLPDSDSCPKILDECERLKSILLDKYHKYLSLEKEKKYIKELCYIESEVKQKYLEFKLFEQQIMEYSGFRR